MNIFINLGVGVVSGIFSAMGVGGGSLLMIYLIQFAGIGQKEAQLTNLLYFIPIAMLAVLIQNKNGFLHKKTGLVTALFGLVFVIIGSWVAILVDQELLRKGFGIMLFVLGLNELFRK